MKNNFIILLLLTAVAVSVFFVYQRSFVWKNFELINSEEEGLEEEMIEGETLEEDPAGVDAEADTPGGSEAEASVEAPDDGA